MPVLSPNKHDKKLHTVKDHNEQLLKDGDKPDLVVHVEKNNEIGLDSDTFLFSTLINEDDGYGKVVIEKCSVTPIVAIGTVRFKILSECYENHVQIESAVVDEYYQYQGIGFAAYKCILNSYNGIISDTVQTEFGAGFWNEKLADDNSLTVNIIVGFDPATPPVFKLDSNGDTLVYDTDLNVELGEEIWGTKAEDNTDYTRITHSSKVSNEDVVLVAKKAKEDIDAETEI